MYNDLERRKYKRIEKPYIEVAWFVKTILHYFLDALPTTQ